MSEIITLTICLAPYVSETQLKQLRHIIVGLLGMCGRVTMLGLSRWTADGGSYRTIQRWFQAHVDWGLVLWIIIKMHLLNRNGEYLLAGDDVVVSKAGKKTYGVGRFYSSIAGRPISSLSFLTLSLIDVAQRRSYPLAVAQHLPAAKTAPPAKTVHSTENTDTVAPSAKRGRGRPKGSKNHAKPAPVLSAELTLLQTLIQQVLARIAPLPVKHLVLDGFFGNYPTTGMVRGCGLHLISKLRHDAALYFPYTGPKPKRGPTPRYGDKLTYKALPEQTRCSSVTEGRFRIDTYQLTLWHKDFHDLLNVVVVLKTDNRTHKSSHVVLFSTDLCLTAVQLVDYYSLRFQIEFNFRDAKQYWGLEDFMNVSPLAVTNAVGLAFLMVNLSAVLLVTHRTDSPDFSILDLKALFRARRYLHETIFALPEALPPHIVSAIWQRFTALGAIRPLHKFRNAA